MKYVLALAVFAVVALPVVAMAGDAEQANAVGAAGAVQLSDEEMGRQQLRPCHSQIMDDPHCGL